MNRRNTVRLAAYVGIVLASLLLSVAIESSALGGWIDAPRVGAAGPAGRRAVAAPFGDVRGRDRPRLVEAARSSREGGPSLPLSGRHPRLAGLRESGDGHQPGLALVSQYGWDGLGGRRLHCVSTNSGAARRGGASWLSVVVPVDVNAAH